MSYDPFGIANIRSLLNDNGLYLSKNRGQNYLINKQTAEKIVSYLPDLQENEEYFEVGTGLGALTTILVERGKTLSLEIDQGVFNLVRKKFQHPNLQLLHQDFLKYQLSGKKYIFISNLPYSISGEAIKNFIENDSFNFGVLMLQKEFADRMEASIDSSNYGPLSVIVQNFLTIKKLFSVSKGNFFPEPKIDSLVISIEKKELETPISQKEFAEFIKICFLAKRKTLANNLSKSIWKDHEIAQHPLCKKRPDAITPSEWKELFLLLS